MTDTCNCRQCQILKLYANTEAERIKAVHDLAYVLGAMLSHFDIPDLATILQLTVDTRTMVLTKAGKIVEAAPRQDIDLSSIVVAGHG